MNTLFERIGGEAAVEAAVERFYQRVLTDARVRDFFPGVDIERQKAKQRAFLTMAFGGPSATGRSMRAAHADAVGRGLNDSHFDAIVELLGGTLKELGVADALIAEVAAIAESVRDDVLNRTPASVS